MLNRLNSYLVMCESSIGERRCPSSLHFSTDAIHSTQATMDHSTHKCCLGSYLVPEGGERVTVQGMLDQRVYAASRRARAASLGLLTLLRRKVEDVLLGDDGGPDDFIDRLVAHGPLLINEGEDAVALWDKGDCKRLARQLMLGTAAADHPIKAVEELHDEVDGVAGELCGYTTALQ
jgi:hypothetical protein